MKKWLLVVFCSILLSGCIHPYVPSVQQGNVLSSEQVNQLKIGMTKDDVQYLLGTSILTDDLSSDQWNYVYTLKLERQPIQIKHLALYFKNDKLIRMDGDKSLEKTPDNKPKK